MGYGAPRLLDALHDAVSVPRDEARADIDGHRFRDLAVLDDGDLRGAAAHIHVHARPDLEGARNRAGAVRAKDALQVRPGGRADETPACRGQHPDDRFGVVLPHGLAGADDRAGVDVVRLQFGFRVALLHELRRASRCLSCRGRE